MMVKKIELFHVYNLQDRQRTSICGIFNGKYFAKCYIYQLKQEKEGYGVSGFLSVFDSQPQFSWCTKTVFFTIVNT